MTREQFIQERDQLLALPEDDKRLPSREFAQQFWNNRHNVRLTRNDFSDDGQEYYEYAVALMLDKDDGEHEFNHLNLHDAIDHYDITATDNGDEWEMINPPKSVLSLHGHEVRLTPQELNIIWELCSTQYDQNEPEDYDDFSFDARDVDHILGKFKYLHEGDPDAE